MTEWHTSAWGVRHASFHASTGCVVYLREYPPGVCELNTAGGGLTPDDARELGEVLLAFAATGHLPTREDRA